MLSVDFLGDLLSDYVETEKINIKPAIDPPIIVKCGMGFNWEIPSAAASSRLDPYKGVVSERKFPQSLVLSY